MPRVSQPRTPALKPTYHKIPLAFMLRRDCRSVALDTLGSSAVLSARAAAHSSWKRCPQLVLTTGPVPSLGAVSPPVAAAADEARLEAELARGAGELARGAGELARGAGEIVRGEVEIAPASDAASLSPNAHMQTAQSCATKHQTRAMPNHEQKP
eukprot:6172864-Pleurochrysis_carterae.AAC.1